MIISGLVGIKLLCGFWVYHTMTCIDYMETLDSFSDFGCNWYHLKLCHLYLSIGNLGYCCRGLPSSYLCTSFSALAGAIACPVLFHAEVCYTDELSVSPWQGPLWQQLEPG